MVRVVLKRPYGPSATNVMADSANFPLDCYTIHKVRLRDNIAVQGSPSSGFRALFAKLLIITSPRWLVARNYHRPVPVQTMLIFFVGCALGIHPKGPTFFRSLYIVSSF